MADTKLNRIKAVLRYEGRTNKWLARQVGRNEVTVSRWCSNVQQPDLETLYKIARILGVHVCELLTDELPTRTTEDLD